MRQIRHIVPGIYHREIKKATNYIRITNGNKNRDSSIRTTYSSGGISTSTPYNKEDKPIEVEDNDDDTIFVINSKFLINNYLDLSFHTTGGGAQKLVVDYGDGTISEYNGINYDLVHKYKTQKLYTIKLHHKRFIVDSVAYSESDDLNSLHSIVSIIQYGKIEMLWSLPYLVGNKNYGAINLESIPNKPWPEDASIFGTFQRSKIKNIPNGFLENLDLGTPITLRFAFAFSEIEYFPSDLFLPLSNKDVVNGEKMFYGCKKLKTPFPSSKFQPSAWKTEEGQKNYRGIFGGCTNIPNYNEIPPILRDESL